MDDIVDRYYADHSMKKLYGLLLSIHLNKHDHRKYNIHIDYHEIKEKTNLSRSTQYRLLKKLVDLGLISKSNKRYGRSCITCITLKYSDLLETVTPPETLDEFLIGVMLFRTFDFYNLTDIEEEYVEKYGESIPIHA